MMRAYVRSSFVLVGVILWPSIGVSNGIPIDGTAPSAPAFVREGGSWFDVDFDGDGQYTIQWARATDMESGIAAYELQERVGPAGSWNTLTSTAAGAALSVNGRADATRYAYRVRAKNNAGLWGAWSAASDGLLIDKTVPAPVPSIADDGATTMVTSQIHAAWTPASDAQSGIVGYEYEIRRGSPTGSIVAFWMPLEGATEITVGNLYLALGARYYIGVRARNGAGLYSAARHTDGILVQPDQRVPSGPSVVTISGYQLLLRRRNPDGTLPPAAPFVMQAVNWSPASRTTATWSGDINNVAVRRPEFGKWYLTDIPVMKAMGVNTVRLFMDPGLPGDPNLTVPGLTVLDELYRYGLSVIMTVDSANNSVSRIQPVVNHYKNHPAILMWSLGSEWSLNRFWKPQQFPTVDSAAVAIESAAQLVKAADASHPVVSSYGTMVNAPNRIEAYVNQICPSIDVWSFNEYQGPGFSRLFDRWRFISTKPMFLGEFGIDAYDSVAQREDQATHGIWGGQLWDEIARNLSAYDPGNVALGGAPFSLVDEFWKSGAYNVQDTGGWHPIAFPDGAASEDYWGILTIDRIPRQLYAALMTRFVPEYQPPPRPQTVTYRANSHTPIRARFWEDGAVMYEGVGGTMDGGRGFNIAAIDLVTGSLRDPIQRFDTWHSRATGTGAAMTAMNAYLDSVPNGTLLLIAIADEAGLNDWSACTFLTQPWVSGAVSRLRALGSTQIGSYCYGDRWAMIAIKGQGVALGEARGTGSADALVQAVVQLQ
jgi:hypothetical protein